MNNPSNPLANFPGIAEALGGPPIPLPMGRATSTPIPDAAPAETPQALRETTQEACEVREKMDAALAVVEAVNRFRRESKRHIDAIRDALQKSVRLDGYKLAGALDLNFAHMEDTLPEIAELIDNL